MGVLAQTISPYLFFWQASEEVEEERIKHMLRLNKQTAYQQTFMRLLRIDNICWYAVFPK